jgi:hypothetical protein
MAIQQDNTLGSLAGILGSIPGLAEAIGGKTTTSSTSMNPQGMTYLLQQILSGTNGLASVASGQNTAGMYNSTVQTQMVNDLLARSAGEVASKQSTTTQQVQPTINLGQTLLQGAAGLIGTKILSKGVDTLGSSVSDALGLTGGAAEGVSSAAGSAAAGANLLSAAGGGADAFSIGSVPGAVANAAIEGAGASVGAGGAGTAGSAATAGLSSAVGDTATGALGSGLASALGIGGTAGAVGAATAGGLAAGGATLGGLGGAIAGDVAAATSGIAAGAGVGAGAAGAAAAGGGLADALASVGAILSWVVCTELEIQGELDHATYQKAAPDFVSRMHLKPSAVRGYHFWAVPYTRLMRRKNLVGRIARAAIKPLAKGRADFINGRWNLTGWITFNVLEPICSLLGNTVARKPQNWKSLYKQGEK